MALTNPRPLPIPALESEILHNNASPVFQASSLVFSPKADGMQRLESMGIMPGTPSSEDSCDGVDVAGSKSKGTPKRDSSPLEISKIIPVTGERPMPRERSSPLDDDVLYAVFIILWEKDPTLQGMTVKQLSDHLLEKHPEMNNLSTKLSNLISAKLNAYVKKLEKGEKTLVYALSREWSNSSPRRMVYVYRGVLSPDYKKHAQAASVQMKQQNAKSDDIESSTRNEGTTTPEPIQSDSKRAAGGPGTSFSLNSEFNVPYSTSPVSAMLTPNATGEKKMVSTSQKRPQEAEADDQNTKRSKLNFAAINAVSNAPFNNNENNNSTYVTAAAAAPRLSKSFAKNNFKANANNSAGVMAAIHKVIYTQTPIESKRLSQINPRNVQRNISCTTWLKSVRSGFLTSDIESPESISFDDLECIFS
ncbi:GDS1 (YOR355W) [Zygosaccharomyces parabailii]|nr:GDS1 (YOR355W) [Zygosaccharomyces parabailii]